MLRYTIRTFYNYNKDKFKKGIPKLDSELVEDYVNSLKKKEDQSTQFSGSKVNRPLKKYEFYKQPIRTVPIFEREIIKDQKNKVLEEKKRAMIEAIKSKIKQNPEKKEYFENFYSKFRSEEIDKTILVELSKRDNNLVYDEISLDRPNNPQEFLKLHLDKVQVNQEFVLSEKQTALLDYFMNECLDEDKIKEINQLCKDEFIKARNLYIATDFKKAFEIFSRLANEHSHGLSHIFLGEMYYTGTTGIVKQDFDKAFDHFTKASHFRIPVAFGMLGELSYKGLAHPKNIRLRTTGYNNNNLIIEEEDEEFNGNESEEGQKKKHSNENNFIFPLVYFSIASNLNLKSSIEQLVFIHMKLNNIHGTIQNLKRLALNHNDINACTTIGALLLDNYPQFTKDIWLYASKMGDTNAQTNLGRYYYSSENPDYNNAVLLWEAAAKENNAEAQFYLGGMYQQGLVVERNSKKAYQLYEKSANGGNSNAQFLVGKAYYEGEDLPMNKELGLQYIKKSSLNQNSLAIEYLDNLNNNNNI